MTQRRFRWEAVGEEDLEGWGRRVGAEVRGHVVFALEGPLGAGKSVFARAVVRGAGVDGPIPSPTYTLLNRYEGRGGRVVVHTDLYRVRDPEELEELGWGELGAEDEIALIEWPDRAEDDVPGDRWILRIDTRPGEPHLRDISLEPVGEPAAVPLMRERVQT